MNNPLSSILSFFDPQANRQRLEDRGFYQPRGQAPMPPRSVQPQGQVAGQFSMGQTSGEFNPLNQSPPQGTYSVNPNQQRYNTAAVKAVIDNFVAAGYSPEFAAGQAANMQVESGGNPAAFNKDEGAFGAFQHRDDRLANLKAFAADRNLSLESIDTQAQFSIYEYQQFEKAAYDKILGDSPQTAPEYAAAIDKYYERSSGEHVQKRMDLAHQIYSDFFGGAQPNMQTENGNVLTYGAQTGSVDPLSVDQGYSNGIAEKMFQTLNDAVGEKKAMEVLNATASQPDQVQALISALIGDGPNFEDTGRNSDPAQQYAEQIGLSFGNMPIGEGAGMDISMGQSPSQGTAPSSPAAAPAATATPAQGGGAEEQPPESRFKGPVEKIVDFLYNTDRAGSEDSMTDDERRDRRRAIGQALGQGFTMLSRGTPMDIQPIVAQKMELQQLRRSGEEMKKNGQAIADMMVAAGYGDKAQLAFMGKEGMTAAINMLTTAPTDGPFDVPSSVRAIAAQNLVEMGRPDMAELVMTTPKGDAFKEVWGATLGIAPPKASATDSEFTYSPEQLTSYAAQLEESNPAAAAILRSNPSKSVVDDILKNAGKSPEGGTYSAEQRQALIDEYGAKYPAIKTVLENADDTTLGKIIEAIGKAPVETAQAVETAAGTEAVKSAISTGEAQQRVAGLVKSYQTTDPEMAAAISTAQSPDDVKTIMGSIDAKRTQELTAQTAKTAGEAFASIIPDDAPNAEALREAARNSTTAEQLKIVFDTLKSSDKTPDQAKLWKFVKENPQYMKMYEDDVRAKAGVQYPTMTAGQSILLDGITTMSKMYYEGKLQTDKTKRDMVMSRQIALDPNLDLGKIQQQLLIPMQNWANSIMGDAAPNFVSDGTVTADRLLEVVTNDNFAAASSLLSGAISNVEGQNFKDTYANTGDDRVKMLAVIQRQLKMQEIRDKEQAWTMEWMDENVGKESFTQANLSKYLLDKAEGESLRVFGQEAINMQKDGDKLDSMVNDWIKSGKYEEGEVVQVIDTSTGARTFVALGNFPND